MTTASSVEQHLRQKFESQPIVFWHDPEGEFAESLSELTLSGASILRVANNEFTIKHQLITRSPKEKFLVYRTGTIPPETKNWLLDQELTYGVFTADSASMLRQELHIQDAAIESVIQAHQSFFNSSVRVTKLKELLQGNEDSTTFKAKMCAVLMGQRDHSLQEITRSLLIEYSKAEHDKRDSLERFGLLEFHWQGTATIYGYDATDPTIEDFTLWMFTHALHGFQDPAGGTLANLKRDFASFRYEKRSEEALRLLAKSSEEKLKIEQQLNEDNIDRFLNIDCYPEIDRRFILLLARQITRRTIGDDETNRIIDARESSIWFFDFAEYYSALRSASALLSHLNHIDLTITSFDQGLSTYASDWFRIDQSYRHFMSAYAHLEHPEVLADLRERIEQLYLNDFIFPLGAKWQDHLAGTSRWESSVFTPQWEFYDSYVKPLIQPGSKKAVVIISDAMRYEIAEELSRQILHEDRFDAHIDPMLGVIPSFTQLGMAALLPHKQLAFDDSSYNVLVDGKATNGTSQRHEILSAVDGAAFRADEILSKSNHELKSLYTKHRVFYIYHNQIDATGDSANSEGKTFQAVETALTEILRLIKKMTSANATNIFITADHGFLYQESELSQHAFLSEQPQGDIAVHKRRFAIGTDFKPSHSYTTFEAEAVHLQGDLEICLPNSIHRYRRQGKGSRFVHGGAALQEIVIPVVSVNKKRKSTTRPVRVQSLQDQPRITTQHVIHRITQTEPVTDQVHPLTLRIGLYADTTLISNQVNLTFNSRSLEPREWEQKAQLSLTAEADKYSNQTVQLVAESLIPNTSQWTKEFSANYRIERTFGTDFEF